MRPAAIFGPARAPLEGKFRVPGDKSIGHRALLLSAVADGGSRISGLPEGEDVASTRGALEALGVRLEDAGEDTVVVEGVGLGGLRPPARPIDCGGSATTVRLLSGMVAGQGFPVTLVGDRSLSRRPMERIVEPLRRMNAEISGREMGCSVLMPLIVGGAGPLQALRYVTPVASAQVKSCMLLAGLRASGLTAITEPAQSRDHTETMLAARGVEVSHRGLTVCLRGPVQRLPPLDVKIPGDPSSASFLLVAAALIPGSNVEVEDVCLNPTRLGFVATLRRMGAAVTAEMPFEQGGEVLGRLVARAGEPLRAVEIAAEEVPSLIDEIPVLAVAAALAEGESRFLGCAELRAKESDRLSSIVSMLRAFGVEAREELEGFRVRGTAGKAPRGEARVDAGADHRIAMAAIILSLLSSRPSEILGAQSMATSFPGFLEALRSLGARW